MHSSSPFLDLLKGLLQSWFSQAPLFIAYFTALIVVILRWRQVPRASLLALAAILIGLLQLVVMPAIYNWVPGWVRDSEVSATDLAEKMKTIYMALGVVGAMFHAAVVGLLVAAVYAGRRPASGG